MHKAKIGMTSDLYMWTVITHYIFKSFVFYHFIGVIVTVRVSFFGRICIQDHRKAYIPKKVCWEEIPTSGMGEISMAHKHKMNEDEFEDEKDDDNLFEDNDEDNW